MLVIHRDTVVLAYLKSSQIAHGTLRWMRMLFEDMKRLEACKTNPVPVKPVIVDDEEQYQRLGLDPTLLDLFFTEIREHIPHNLFKLRIHDSAFADVITEDTVNKEEEI